MALGDETLQEHQRLSRLRGMHARSEYADRPLIVVGETPRRILYLANRFVVEFSDDGGLTWVTWPGTEDGIETDELQRAILNDYDYPIQFQRLYRTYGLGELAETSPMLLHTEDTNYRVMLLRYEALDVPSPRRLADMLAEHAVTLPSFTCFISARVLLAEPRQRFDDMRVARQKFEQEADEWLLEAETLGGFGLALQFRGAQCEGSPGGALWQIIPTPRSAPTSAQIGAPPVDHLLDPVGEPVGMTEVVRHVRDRVRRASLHREPIASLAYWQREVLESHFGGRQQACSALNISSNLWTEIGRLSARHDWREGRKVVSELSDPPLHRRELLLLTVACRHLLHRLAVAETGALPSTHLTLEAVKDVAEQEFALEQARPSNPAGGFSSS
jgi:hypothetical protein